MKKTLSLFLVVLLCLLLTGCKTHESTDMSKHEYKTKLIKSPTATEDGLVEYKCKSCDYKFEEKITTLNHIHNYTSHQEIESTCLESGYDESTCECGYTPKTYRQFYGHEYGEYKVIKAPTVQEDGLMYTKCLKCDEEYEVTMSKLDKSYSTNITYAFDEKTKSYTVTGLINLEGYNTDRNIVIPSFYNNYPVTKIGDSAFNQANVKNVDLPNSIVEIGILAFRGLECEDFKIPDSVTIIGDAAFRSSRFKTITLSKNLLIIGEYAFDSCFELTAIDLPDGLAAIKRGAFTACNKILKIRIPSSVKYVGEFLFERSGNLNEVEIESAKTIIQYKAFSSFGEKQNVYFHGNMYDWCNNSFGISVFSSNSSLFLKDKDGNWKEVVNLVIPESVTKINPSTFENFAYIQSVKLPSSVTYIGFYAFNNCKNLSKISIPKGVIEIDSYAFAGCFALKKIVIPKTVLKMSGYVFSECNPGLIITCKMLTKPEGWNESWSYSWKDYEYEIKWDKIR